MATVTQLRGSTETLGSSRSNIQLNWSLVLAVTSCLGIWALVASIVIFLT